jgi:hypothetical protein
MSVRRIPKKDGDFDQYINNTVAALEEPGPPPAYQRLGLSVTEKDQWVTYHTDWRTIYPKYTNLATRTASITAQKNTIKKDFTAFAAVLLTRMGTMPTLTQDDREVFNIPARDTTPTKRGKINDTPYATLEPVGVGTVKVRVRMTHDSKRSSMHPLADGIEVRYAIVEQGTKPQGPDPAQPSANAPTTPSEAPFTFTSTKALFELTFDGSASGKRLYAFLRWVNQSAPVNNGFWTTPLQTIIL